MRAHRERINSGESNAKWAPLLGGAVLLAAAGTAAEALLTYTDKEERDRTNKADVLSITDRPGDTALFFVPGYHANGRVIAKNIDRHLEHLGPVHYAVHPEKGFSLESIKEAWIAARRKDGYRPVDIHAESMGALVTAVVLSDPIFRKEFGEIRSIDIDCGLSGRSDLGLHSKLAMAAGLLLPVTYTSGKIYRKFNGQDLRRGKTHAPEVFDSEVEEHLRSSAETSFSAGRAQIWFMHTHDAADLDLSDLDPEVVVRYVQPRKDNVVNNERAAKVYSETYGRPIERWVATWIREGHALAPEWPQTLIDTTQNINRDEYRIVSVDESQVQQAPKRIYLPNGHARVIGEPAA